MEVQFYIDPETRMPHIHGHHVEEHEIREALRSSLEIRRGTEGVLVAIGCTVAGRYLRVVFVPDPGDESAFVITAYELGPRALWALRRRKRRKR
jgi:hypothetical protein